MECFMRNISFQATETDLRQAISTALHGGEFTESGANPINFHIHLHGNKLSHKGRGSLTLPEVAIGNAFIQRYGAGQLVVKKRPVYISLSNRAVRQDIVTKLRQTTYHEQSEAEERLAARAEDLSASTPLVRIEQGWLQRDSTFSSEYTIEKNDTIKGLSLHFEDTSRQIVLKITTSSGFFSIDPIYQIRFRYSDISNIFIDNTSEHSVVLFQLRNSVSYERAAGELLSQFASILQFEWQAPPARIRMSSLELDNSHAELSPYISRNVVVHLTNTAAADFARLLRVARLSFHPAFISIVKSNLFGPGKLLGLRQWIVNHQWEVSFQLEKILENMLLSPEEFNTIRPSIDELIQASRNNDRVVSVLLDFIARLEILAQDEENPDEGESFMECLEAALKKSNKSTPVTSRLRRTRKEGIDGEFPCLHVVVTPTRIVLEGPSPEQLNRVLRMYPNNWNNFLRVRFADEQLLSFRWDQEVNAVEFVKKRIGGVLRNGIDVAGKHFEYLAYSSSALKTHTVWFVCPFVVPGKGLQDAAAIIRALGDFSRDSRFPARMGARIAQAFSSTDLSISASVEEVITVPDIERNGSLFTDGVGTISPDVAAMMWASLNKLRRKRANILPAAYQVRLGGYKGMLAIDYRLEGSIICVRKSMDKFDSPSLDVEVARAFDRPGPCFLNRPLIMILETANKVPAEIFLTLQERAVRETREAMRTFDGAVKLLEFHGLGASFKLPSIITRLHNIGVEVEDCEALGMKIVLNDAETDILRELKYRARIPVSESWKLVGIADEFNYLRPGEIYACVRNRDEEPDYLEGPFLITRSPAIHPGDVQVVTAIGRPPPGTPFDIEPLANTVVLSCQGDRSLASCLGGGDLDGDLYDLINLTVWPELAPQTLVEPAEYPPAPKKEIKDRDCTIDDVKDFICDFITSDMVGVISVRHLKLADHSPLGVNDPNCLALAALHSKAVDFPKSGMPVAPTELPRTGRMLRPDWDAGELGFRDGDETYQSSTALGRLFRAIKLSEGKLQRKGTHPSSRFATGLSVATHAKPLPRNKLDLIGNRMRIFLSRHIDVDEVPQEYFDEAVDLLEEYIGELTRICNTYALTSRSVLSEEEVVAGTILERTSQHRRRRDMISEMRTASSSLVANVHDILKGSDSDSVEDWMLRSWAGYQVARAFDEFGCRSFELLMLGNSFDAIEAITQRNLVR